MAYPASIDTFAPRTDNVDDVLATDINSAYTVIEAIETELGTDPAGTAADVKTRLAHSLSDGGFLSFDDATEVTIADGAAAITQNFHFLDTEGDAASDFLDTISGGEAGWWAILRSTNDARDIVIRHAVDNIYCSGGVNITLGQTNEIALAIYDGTLSKWLIHKGAAGSSISGSGTAGQVPYFSAENTVISDDDFAFSTTSGLVLNESGGTAVDFRVESDTNEYMLFMDASANTFQIGDDTGGNYAIFSGAGAITLYGNATLRTATAVRRRYYHLPLFASNPGASGPTFVACDTNTLGGWQLNAVGELLYFDTDVHSDWDAASDLTVEVKFEVNVDNTGGGAGDTVDLRLQTFYKGNAETSCKTQVLEVATTVGASARYKRFTCNFTIDYDAVGNVVEAGDVISMILNLETDSSEVDDVVISDCSFYYNTTHIGTESGDV